MMIESDLLTMLSKFGSDAGVVAVLAWLGKRLVQQNDRLCDQLASVIEEFTAAREAMNAARHAMQAESPRK